MNQIKNHHTMKKPLIRIACFLLVLLFLLPMSVDLLQLLPVRAAGGDEMNVSLTWVGPAASGTAVVYENDGALLSLTPATNTAVTVKYQLVFSLPQEPADRVAAPGELEVRIPMYIFDARAGGYLVNTTLANSYGDHELRVQNQNHVEGLYSYQDTATNEFVIKNWRSFDAGENAVMDVSYTFIPSNIENGFSRTVDGGNPITATAAYKPAEGETVSATSNPLEIEVKTFVAAPAGFTKALYTNAKYESWQSSWTPTAWPASWGGTPEEQILWRTNPEYWPTAQDPFDQDDYIYLIWQIRYQQNIYSSTQPYTIDFTDILGDLGDGVVVGISGTNNTTGTAPGFAVPFVGQNQTQIDAAQMTGFLITPITTSSTRYWYRWVLVRYPRGSVPPGTTVTNDAVATIKGIDAASNPVVWGPTDLETGLNPRYAHSTAQPRASYTYNGIHFTYSGGLYGTSKSYIGGTTSPGNTLFSAINRLESDNPTDLIRTASDAYTFAISASAQGWSLTRETGVVAIPNDVEWYTENEGWDFEGIKAYAEEIGEAAEITNPVVTMNNGWIAVYAGRTYSTTTTPVYWEIFKIDGEDVSSLGFIRTAIGAAPLTQTAVTVPIELARREGYSTYYKKNYSVELLDAMMFLDDQRLDPDDYAITSTYLAYTENVHIMDENSGAVSATAATDYQNYAPVILEYRRASMDGWQTAGSILRDSSAYTYTPIYSGAPQLQNPGMPLTSANQIQLPDDTYEIRFLHENSRYSVSITAYFKTRLNPTGHVMDILEGKTTATLININSMVVRDSVGNIKNAAPHGSIYRNVNDSSGVSGGTTANPGADVNSIKRTVMENDHEMFDTAYQNYDPAAASPPAYVAADRAVQHYYASLVINKTPTGTTRSKTADAVTDNSTTGIKTSRQTITMYESIMYNPAIIPGSNDAQRLASLEADGLFTVQREGTFYDLLPAGTTFSESSLEVRTYYSSDNTNYRRPCTIDYYTVDNWQGTGRTMLIVHAIAPTVPVTTYYPTPNYQTVSNTGYYEIRSGFVLRYNLNITYATIFDRAAGGSYTPTNLAAYRAGSGTLADAKGIYAGGGTVPPVESSAWYPFRSLESAPDVPDDHNDDTVYMSAGINFTVPGIAVYGIDKKVRAQNDLDFVEETTTIPGGLYYYQLRFQSNRQANTSSRDVVLYDVLEDAEGWGWQGRLIDVDVSLARSKGIDPVVYYSTQPGLSPVIEDSGGTLTPDGDLEDDGIWVKWKWWDDGAAVIEPPPDLSAVTAIAIDLSKSATENRTGATDGWQYVFKDADSVTCQVVMRAPTTDYDDYILKNDKAINKMSYYNNYMAGATGVQVPTAKLSAPTEVSIRELKFAIEKSANPPSGGDASSPAPVNIDDIFEYTISVINKDSLPVTGVKFYDVIPDGLEIVDDEDNPISYYFGSNPSTAVPVSESSIVHMEQDGQELAFVIDDMNAMQTANIIIPVKVIAGDTLFVNSASITEINDGEYDIESNTTYHQVFPKIQLTGAKTIAGRNLAANEFEFIVTDVTDANPENHKIAATAKNKVDGSIDFPDIFFTDAGEYKFEVSEVDRGTPTIECDATVYSITVVVKNDDGIYIDTISIDEDEVFNNSTDDISAIVWGIEFENIFNAPDISLTLKTQTHPLVVGRKTITNKGLEDDEFVFEIKDITPGSDTYGEIVATGTNQNNGYIDFGAITYTQSDAGKTFTYIVSEVKPGSGDVKYDEWITYDNTTYELTVVVSKDPVTGLLSAAPSITGKTVGGITETTEPGPIAFHNEYTTPPADFSLAGRKALSGGRALKAGEFLFEITGVSAPGGGVAKVPSQNTATNDAAGNIVFGNIRFYEEDAGTHVYTVSEVKPSTPDTTVTYDERVFTIAVTVAKNTYSGRMEATARVTFIDGESVVGSVPLEFNNVFTPGPITLTMPGASKEFPGGRELKPGEFSFSVTDITVLTSPKPVTTGTNKADGTITFADDLVFDNIGSYRFRVQEIVPAPEARDAKVEYDNSVYTVDVTVISDSTTGELSFSGLPLIQKVVDGSYQSAATILFTNTFTPDPVYLTGLAGSKELTGGRDLRNGEFAFEIKNSSNVIVSTGTNTSGGAISFVNIPFNAVGNYSFTISEVEPTTGKIANVFYDKTVFNMTIEVTQDSVSGVFVIGTPVISGGAGDGQIKFTNVFAPAPASVPLSGTKILTGKDQTTGEFSFEVKDMTEWSANYDTVIATGTNTAAASGAAGAISFTQSSFTYFSNSDVGVHTYTVSEVKGTNDYISYDATVFTIQITVALDPYSGVLTATQDSITGSNGSTGSIGFENKFNPNAISVALPTGTKTLTGDRDLKAGDFEFVLTEISRPTGSASKLTGGAVQVTNTGASADNIVFSDLVYGEEDVGEHVYSIKEVIPDDADDRIEYDETVYTLTVTIGTDLLTGDLTQSVKITLEGVEVTLAFNNTYALSNDSITLHGSKTLTGRSPDIDEFSFVLTDITNSATPEELCTVRNAIDGTFTFDPIQYSADDIGNTYVYEISEVIPEALEIDPRIEYDTTAYTVTVTVGLDRQTGELTLTRQITDSSGTVGTITFYNKSIVHVTFDANGGQETDSERRVYYGETVDDGITYDDPTGMPPTPTRPGYRFLGWATQPEDGTTPDFFGTSQVTDDITVYAQWEILGYTVTFDGNGGTPDEQVVSGFYYNDSFNSREKTFAQPPSRIGYTFIGWNTEWDGSGVGFTDLTSITDDITVYAQWEAIEYTVMYYPGEYGDWAPGDTDYTTAGLYYGDVTPDPATVNSFDGDWHFAKWSPVWSDTVTDDVIYTALWVNDPDLLIVSFHPGTGGLFPSEDCEPVPPGSPTPNPSSAPSSGMAPIGETGWVFAGWLPVVNGYAIGEPVYSFEDIAVTGHVDYIAQWIHNPELYTVTFDPGEGGDWDPAEDGVYNFPNLQYGEQTPLQPTSPPAKPGWIFNGWSPVWSGTVTGDVTYVAQWTKEETKPPATPILPGDEPTWIPPQLPVTEPAKEPAEEPEPESDTDRPDPDLLVENLPELPDEPYAEQPSDWPPQDTLQELPLNIVLPEGTTQENFPNIDLNAQQSDLSQPGGDDYSAPPVPNDPDNMLMVQIDEDGNIYFLEITDPNSPPLGMWSWSEEEGRWIYIDMELPLGELPATGLNPICSGFAFTGFALIVLGLLVRRKPFLRVKRSRI